jgi:LPXTG-motif cell wall-anchored protein
MDPLEMLDLSRRSVPSSVSWHRWGVVMHRYLGGVALAVVTVVTVGVVTGPASAQEGEPPIIDIPLDTVVEGAAGTEAQLTVVDVDPDDVGKECSVVADGANNESVHEGTNLIVRSGDSEVTVPDVEREPGIVTPATGTLVLGEQVTVSVQFGPDEVFSGGLVVTVDCTESPTTTEPTTTVPASTTTEPPPPTTAPPPSTPSSSGDNPSPTLPNTGAGTDALLVVAGLVLLVGAGALAGSAKLRQRSQS